MPNKKKKIAKRAREVAKATPGMTFQAARRGMLPEQSSFVEQMSDLTDGTSRIHSFACCGFTQVFACQIEPGFADWEDVHCTHCGLVLANVRCDLGSPRLVREVRGDANAGYVSMRGSDGTVMLGKRAK